MLGESPVTPRSAIPGYRAFTYVLIGSSTPLLFQRGPPNIIASVDPVGPTINGDCRTACNRKHSSRPATTRQRFATLRRAKPSGQPANLDLPTLRPERLASI